MGAEGPDRGTVPTDVTGRRGHSVREGRTTKLSRGEGGEGLRPGGSGVPVLTFCGAAGACPSCRPPRTAWAAACGPAGPALPGRREQPGAGVSGSGGGRAAPPPPLPPRRPARYGTVRYLCASSSPRAARSWAAAPLPGSPGPAAARQSRPRAGHRPAAAAPPPTAQARPCRRGPGRKGGGGAAAGGGAGPAGAHLRRGAGPQRPGRAGPSAPGRRAGRGGSFAL